MTACISYPLNAGYHTEVMRLAYADFDRLVRPTVMHFATLAA